MKEAVTRLLRSGLGLLVGPGEQCGFLRLEGTREPQQALEQVTDERALSAPKGEERIGEDREKSAKPRCPSARDGETRNIAERGQQLASTSRGQAMPTIRKQLGSRNGK